MAVSLFVIILLSYILGSIPFSYILGKVLKGVDLRLHGSGNVGATNALRVLGWQIGLPALILDIIKGFAAVKIAAVIIPDNSTVLIVAGFTAILGHIFTIFLRFKGGKGVAASAGVFSALIPVPFFIALLSFLLVTALSRYVSLGSIVGALVLVIMQTVYTFQNGMQDYEYLILTIIVALFIIIKHRSNFKRIIGGTENKISFSRKKEQ